MCFIFSCKKGRSRHCISVCLSIHQSIRLSTHPSVCPPIYQSAHLSICPYIHPSVPKSIFMHLLSHFMSDSHYLSHSMYPRTYVLLRGIWIHLYPISPLWPLTLRVRFGLWPDCHSCTMVCTNLVSQHCEIQAVWALYTSREYRGGISPCHHYKSGGWLRNSSVLQQHSGGEDL